MLVHMITCRHVVEGGLLRNLPARTVEIPGQAVQADHRPVILESIGMVGNGTGSLRDRRRSVSRIQFHGFVDVLLLKTGNPCGGIQIELLHIFCIFFKSIGVFLNILLIMPVVLDDQVRHPQRQRAVRARLDL